LLTQIDAKQGTHAHSFVESFFDDVPLAVTLLKKKGVQVVCMPLSFEVTAPASGANVWLPITLINLQAAKRKRTLRKQPCSAATNSVSPTPARES
jgi:hypothetical protein